MEEKKMNYTFFEDGKVPDMTEDEIINCMKELSAIMTKKKMPFLLGTMKNGENPTVVVAQKEVFKDIPSAVAIQAVMCEAVAKIFDKNIIDVAKTMTATIAFGLTDMPYPEENKNE